MAVNFAPHVRVSALGYLGSPAVDRFSFSICMAPQNTAIIASHFMEPVYNYWVDVADSVRDCFNRSATKVSNDAHIDGVKIAWILANGSYGRKPPIVIPYNSAGGITANGTTVPQSALAISLTTDIVSPRTRGRFYLPMPVVNIANSDGLKMTNADAVTVRDSVATMLNDINNAPGVDSIGQEWCVVIASSTGINTPVTGVKVGRVVDTIRTRRNNMREDYTSVASITP